MSKNATIILSVIALIIIGGVLVYAINTTVVSPTTATSTPVVVDNTPTTPATPTVSAPMVVTSSTVFLSDTTAIVNGTVNPKGSFTSYWYEYGNTPNLGSKTSNQTIGSGFLTIQAPSYIINLTKDTTYYYKLVAENQYGRVVGSQYSFRTTVGTPAPVGSAPTTKTLTAGNISRTGATIYGEVTANKATTLYWFEYGKTTALGNISSPTAIGDGSIKIPVSVSIGDLDPLTTYYFRLNAQNQFGTINGAILNFKTNGPAAPTAPKVVSQNATAISTSTAILHGAITPNGAATTYWFEYDTSGTFAVSSINTTEHVTLNESNNTSSVKATITNLGSNTTYYVRLVGQNSAGTVRGDILTFKTK